MNTITKLKQSEKERIGIQGYEACKAGLDCEFGARKYCHDDEQEKRQAWLDGWNVARSEMDSEGMA